jgi:hypothetical protein
MSTIDFNKPATTDLYTAWPTEIQAAQASLGFMLDPTYVTSVANQAAGTKRFSTSSTVFEQWSGSAWAALPTGYALKAGDTFTGAITVANAVGMYWKDGGGVARRTLLGSGANYYIGDIDNVVTGSVLHMTGQSGLSFEVNSTVVGSADAFGINSAGTFTAKASESYRLIGSANYVGGWNSANTTRTGYLQFNAGSAVSLVAENGASLSLGTAGTGRLSIDPSGNVGINQAPSTVAKLAVAGGLYINGPAATLPASIGTGLFSYESPVLREYIGDGTGYSRAFSKRAGSVTTDLMTLNDGGALALFGTMQIQPTNTSGTQLGLELYDAGGGGGEGLYIQWESASRTGMARLLAVGNGTAGGDLVALTNNANTGSPSERLRIDALGRSKFAGSAATNPSVVGSTGGAVILDCSLSNVIELTLTSSITTLTLSNLLSGQTLNIFITQDATGNRLIGALTAANGYVWPGGTVGVLSTAANAVDLLCLTYRASTGKVYCTLSKGFA